MHPCDRPMPVPPFSARSFFARRGQAVNILFILIPTPFSPSPPPFSWCFLFLVWLSSRGHLPLYPELSQKSRSDTCEESFSSYFFPVQRFSTPVFSACPVTIADLGNSGSLEILSSYAPIRTVSAAPLPGFAWMRRRGYPSAYSVGMGPLSVTMDAVVKDVFRSPSWLSPFSPLPTIPLISIPFPGCDRFLPATSRVPST